MLFHIADAGVLAYEEAVDAVVLAVLVAAVVDAAAGDDGHVGALADIKVVVHDLGQTAFGHDHGDVHALALRARFDADLQAAHVGLGDDLDIHGGLAAGGSAVGADVIGAFGHLVQVCHFAQQALLDLVKLHHGSRLLPY